MSQLSQSQQPLTPSQGLASQAAATTPPPERQLVETDNDTLEDVEDAPDLSTFNFAAPPTGTMTQIMAKAAKAALLLPQAQREPPPPKVAPAYGDDWYAVNTELLKWILVPKNVTVWTCWKGQEYVMQTGKDNTWALPPLAAPPTVAKAKIKVTANTEAIQCTPKIKAKAKEIRAKEIKAKAKAPPKVTTAKAKNVIKVK